MLVYTPLETPELISLAHRSAAVTRPCNCSPKSLVGWEGMPVSLKETQLTKVGSLVRGEDETLTLDEYHPDGTHYWSTNAPIAPEYFPYNRCEVWGCVSCGRLFLRHSESGAYHMEQRIRSLDPGLIVDAPLQ